jgi:hypothetical protein
MWEALAVVDFFSTAAQDPNAVVEGVVVGDAFDL